MATIEDPQTLAELQAEAAPPHFSADERLWRDCIAASAQRAKDYYPATIVPTIDKAMGIVLRGDVWVDPIGIGGRVRSESTPGKIYSIGGQGCECQAAAFSPDEENCKHMLAIRIFQRALALKEQFAPRKELPEAPASINTHLTIHGRQCQLTLRGHHVGEVLDGFARLMQQLAAPPSDAAATDPTPALLTDTAPLPDTAPAPTPSPTLPVAPPANGGGTAPLCPVHNRPMRRSQYDDLGFFCTVKDDSGSFCREKR